MLRTGQVMEDLLDCVNAEVRTGYGRPLVGSTCESGSFGKELHQQQTLFVRQRVNARKWRKLPCSAVFFSSSSQTVVVNHFTATLTTPPLENKQ